MSPAAVIKPVFASQVAPRGLLSAVRGIARIAFCAASNDVAGISLRIIRMPGFVQNAIGSHQAIRHRLAEIAVTLETGRAITYHALRRYLAGEDAVREVTMAKLATQRAAFEVCDACLQIHGGAGYMAEYGIERAVRDARLGPIGGGTDEIMKEILGRSLGL